MTKSRWRKSAGRKQSVDLKPKSKATLFEGSDRNTSEKRTSRIGPEHARDWRWMVYATNWRQMLSVGRYLYANVGPVAGAINEIATYAVGDAWLPRYMGADSGWGDTAEEWLESWFDVCDVRGQPYDFRTDLFLSSVSIDRDGDNVMVLTETADNYPMLQFVPAHRVGRPYGNQRVIADGPYKGLELQNGVVLSPVGRPVGFRIVQDEFDQAQDIWLSARDAQINFAPKWWDQGRGLTCLSAAIWDWSDYRDIKDYEKTGIKAASETSVMEHNERGSAQDDGGKHFTNDKSTDITTELLEGGTIRYFKANSGAGLSVLKSERPSDQTQNFITDQIMRGAFAGMEWPIEFSWNPEKLGGANIRMIVEKADRAVKKRQKYLANIYQRAVLYGVAKAIKYGLLPGNDEWYKWDAQLPKSLTVDAGRQSKADCDDYRIGFTTLSEVYGAKGEDWQAGIIQKVKERKFLLTECAAQGVKPEDVQLLTPNGNPAAANTDNSPHA